MQKKISTVEHTLSEVRTHNDDLFNRIEVEKQRINEYDTKVKLIDSSYSSLMKKLKSFTDKLDEKVETEAFDNEINYLKAYIEAIQSTPAGEKVVPPTVV